MRIDLYIVNEKVETIDCPHYERYGKSGSCRFTIGLCLHLPQRLFVQYRDLLKFHQAYGFLCYEARGS